MKFKLFHLLEIAFIMLLLTTSAVGQQNRTLYLQHDVPQASLLNPAVPLNCGWTIGLPVIASVHANYGNNFLAFNQLFTHNGNGQYTSNLYKAEKYFRGNNFLSTEFGVQLLGLGYNRNNWSVMFTAIEKGSTLANIPRDVFKLALHGNTQFEGQRASFNRSSMFVNQYAELGLSVAHQTDNGIHWGVRGKLLFGQINVSSVKTKLGMLTNANTFDLGFDGQVDLRTSMPAEIVIENSRPEDFVRDESVGIANILGELGNPGFAFDAGLIMPLGEKLELSVSLIDLGLIAWRKNVHGYTAGGQFVYTGPFNDSINTEDYLDELSNAFFDSLNLASNTNPYATFLPSKLSAGLTYRVGNRFLLGAMADLQAYRTKLISGMNVSATYEPINNIKGVISWSHQYNTFNNLGAGIIIGKRPVQFYAFTDNFLGLVSPLDARNINFRAGLNIITGCGGGSKQTSKSTKGRISPLQGNCGWVKEPVRKKNRR